MGTRLTIIPHDHGGTYKVTDSSHKAAFMDIAIIDEEGAEIPFRSEPLAPGKMRVTVDAKPGLVFFGVTDNKPEIFRATGDKVEVKESKEVDSLAELLIAKKKR